MNVDFPGVRLMQGDCLQRMKEMPSGSVDMILTDPPYGMKFRSNHRHERHREIANDSGLGWLPAFMKESYRVAADNTGHYFFSSWHNIDVFKQAAQSHFKIKNILVWEKNNTSMGDLAGDFAPKVEFILFCHKGRARIRGKRDPNIFKFSRTANELHPTQKPVDLCAHLIEKFSDQNQTVFDPFMGSGSTGVAAILKKRRFIGVELDHTYFGTSVQRIGEEVAK